MNTYTREEVAKHCTKESCWIVVGRNVYLRIFSLMS